MAILRKLPAAVAVAALTATLVGCGSSDVRDERDQALMERDAAQAAAEQAQMEAEQAQAAAEQAQMDAEQAQAAVDQAQMEADAAVEEAQMEADAAVEQAQMEADAAVEEAEAARMAAEEERDRLAQEAADREAAEQTAADRAMVATSRALYQTLDEKMQLDMDSDSITADNKSISWDPPPADVGDTADDEFSLRPSGADPTMMGEWTGNEYKVEVTREARATRDTAMVYTNQGAPTVAGKLFVVEHGDLLDDDTKTSVTDAALDGTTPPTGYTADQIRMYIASPEFAATSGTKTHANNSGGGVGSPHMSFEARGTFDGAPGTYRCVPGTDSTCSSAVQGGTSGNQIQLDGGTWTFTPDVGAMTARSTPDATYFVYGWWLRNSDAEGYEVGTFTDYVGLTIDGSVGDDSDDLAIDALEGSATYMGHAAGKYSLLPGLDNPTGDVGHFTANVMLKAEWGDLTAIGSLSGTVDGFMGYDGMARDWTVELQKVDLTSAGATGDADSVTTGTQNQETVWTIGTAADAAGEWTAQLYEASTSPRTGTPTTVLGEFTAEHGVVGEADSAFGHMAGAFGATLQ